MCFNINNFFTYVHILSIILTIVNIIKFFKFLFSTDFKHFIKLLTSGLIFFGVIYLIDYAPVWMEQVDQKTEMIAQLIKCGILTTAMVITRIFETHYVRILNGTDPNDIPPIYLPLACVDFNKLLTGEKESTKVDPNIDVVYNLLKKEATLDGLYLMGAVILKDKQNYFVYYKTFGFNFFNYKNKPNILNYDTRITCFNETSGLKSLIRITPKPVLSKIMPILPFSLTNRDNYLVSSLALRIKFVLVYYNLWFFF